MKKIRQKRQKIVIHNFYCIKCCHMIPLPRRAGHLRKKAHLKKLYCPNCKRKYNHIEIDPDSASYTYQDFLVDLEEGILY